MKLRLVHEAALHLLALQGGVYYRGCGWCWDTHTGTERLYGELARRGLVSVTTDPGPKHSPRPGGRTYLLTAAGKAFLVSQLEDDAARMPDSVTVRQAGSLAARLEAMRNLEVPS